MKIGTIILDNIMVLFVNRLKGCPQQIKPKNSRIVKHRQ